MPYLNSGSESATAISVVNAGDRLNRVKEAELEWHDAWAIAHARGDYPPTLAEFRERFRRVELTNFCDGGWNWWADARKEALERIGDVRGLRVLDYGCGSGTLGMFFSAVGADVWGFDLSREANESGKRGRTTVWAFRPVRADGRRRPTVSR